MNGAMSVSVSIIDGGGGSSSSSSKAPPCIRLLLVFAPAPCPLVTYDLKLAGAGVPYLTLAATASCGAVARDDAVCTLSQSLRCSLQHASADRGAGHVPVCVCVGPMLVVMGAGGSPVFALHAEQGCGGSELAAGGDSDLILMLPRTKGGGGGNVHVLRWIAAVKLRERDLPQQVTIVVVVAVVVVAMRV